MSKLNGNAGANGTAQDKNKEVANSQTATLPKTELSTVVIPMGKSITIDEGKELPPIGDRFLKMDELYSLRMKWEKLNTSLDKLKQFDLASEGREDTITLNGSKNNSFTTSNPDVYKKVIEWLIEDVSKKLAETAARIVI